MRTKASSSSTWMPSQAGLTSSSSVGGRTKLLSSGSGSAVDEVPAPLAGKAPSLFRFAGPGVAAAAICPGHQVSRRRVSVLAGIWRKMLRISYLGQWTAVLIENSCSLNSPRQHGDPRPLRGGVQPWLASVCLRFSCGAYRLSRLSPWVSVPSLLRLSVNCMNFMRERIRFPVGGILRLNSLAQPVSVIREFAALNFMGVHAGETHRNECFKRFDLFVPLL